VGQPAPLAGQSPVTDVSVCDDGYFRAMKVPLLSGRFFSEREMREKSNVVIVNDTLAKRYFPAGDALGKRLVIAMTDPNVPTEIIGIVADIKFADLATEARPMTFWPHPQLAYNAMTLTIRTAAEPSSRDDGTAYVFVHCSAIASSGLKSHAESHGTAEIVMRLALGAEARDILRMIVGHAVRLAGLGLAIGVVLALALSRTLGSLLYETAGTDPLTFAVVIAVLGSVALVASYFPARRASHIAPVEALRYQ
jgi:putative ABC transport system permease protein